MKKPFWKLAEPHKENFLQVLHDIDINENIKAILKIKLV